MKNRTKLLLTAATLLLTACGGGGGGGGGTKSGAKDSNYSLVNNPPVALSESVKTTEDTAKPITLKTSEANSDSLAYHIIKQPQHGSVSGDTAHVIYTPEHDYNGPDSFTFIATSGLGDSNEATISITVIADNDAPVTTDDTATTDEDKALLIDVLSNDRRHPIKKKQS